MRKKIIQVLNWEKYQARSDKDLPWCKLWGTLFDRPWFQKMPDSCKFFTLVLLDLARKTGNKITEEYVFIEYLRGNYGILSTQNDVFNYCKLLSDKGFLSDNTDDLQDKTRQDKTRESDKSVKTEQENNSFFEKFYASYPKKIARGAAEKVWEKLRPNGELLEQILSGVEKAKNSKDWAKDGGKYIPHPATWLNQKRWLDQHEPEKKGYDIWQTKPIQIPS